jgi:hypothetical protein
LEMVEWRVGRLRHLIWNGYHEEAHDELFGMRQMASEVAYVNGDKFRPAVARLLSDRPKTRLDGLLSALVLDRRRFSGDFRSSQFGPASGPTRTVVAGFV